MKLSKEDRYIRRRLRQARKRPGQFYLQTWHAGIAIKPIGLQRGASFTKIARMVTEHDSRLIDLLVTNSKWVEDHAALGMLYSGKMLRTGLIHSLITVCSENATR